jgi:hypothetical protein
MASTAFVTWTTVRRAALEQIVGAHRRVGGTGPGRRYAMEQINHAYAVLLSSQFQGFCRDLHEECARYISAAVSPAVLRDDLYKLYTLSRKLDTGNPNPGTIGADFGRFGLAFWSKVGDLDIRNAGRQAHLEDLNEWRNAIAHQSFNEKKLGKGPLRLRRVKAWRQACHQLAAAFDEVMRGRLRALTGTHPW